MIAQNSINRHSRSGYNLQIGLQLWDIPCFAGKISCQRNPVGRLLPDNPFQSAGAYAQLLHMDVADLQDLLVQAQ
ncbi:hypothetical protein D3C86_2079230 [compost metagenome]